MRHTCAAIHVPKALPSEIMLIYSDAFHYTNQTSLMPYTTKSIKQ